MARIFHCSTVLQNQGINVRDLGLNEGVRGAHKEVVEYFLDHDGSPNAVNQYINVVLHWSKIRTVDS